jgi:hypothetical protein
MRAIALFLLPGCVIAAAWAFRDDLTRPCPPASARSVEALFAPCQAAGADQVAFGHVVMKSGAPALSDLH